MTTEPLNLRGRLYADEAPPAQKNGTPYPPRDLHDHDAEYDLDGVEEPPEPQGFDPENAQLSAELPPGTALLCVKNTTYAGRPSFELYLHHRGRVRGANRPTDLDQRRQPGLGPARLVELGERSGWRATYRLVKGWWRTETVLADWVDGLRAAENPRLVVWDHTSHEIPWELLYRQPLHETSPADTGGWIGAALPVIRWTTVYDASRAWRYDARPRHCRGGVLVYEDPEFAVPSDSVRRHEVGERSTTMRHLHARLRDKETDFGLLLMRCHGKYSEDVEEFTLGGVPFPELDEDWRMPALHATGAAVLINSCVSARPVVDRRYNAAVPRNFAEIFLRWGAGAVIATLAEVSKVHAHDFAARLVRNAQQGPVNLADALTAHRADYARQAEQAVVEGDDGRAEAAIEGFFTSFMYAYFGHPGTTLALEAPEGDEAP
ncbi:hypothetical protein [Streptomyces sp. NPDC001401]|uniref:hypothetical protein n=1 Tax=Streptomyces sp. NPDC001401 TaxID=3364570 RepID=UPI0036BC8175